MENADFTVLGYKGEVGSTIYSLIDEGRRKHNINGTLSGIDIGVDVNSNITRYSTEEKQNYLFICIPFDENFVENVAKHINNIISENPVNLHVIIHSTVEVGTTRILIKMFTPNKRRYILTHIVFSFIPIRGKHMTFIKDVKRFPLFISTTYCGGDVESVFVMMGIISQTNHATITHHIESLEYAKLLNTTFYGLLIALSQEVALTSKHLSLNSNLIKRFIDDTGEITDDNRKLIPYIMPEGIGGHCVLPNLQLIIKSHQGIIPELVSISNSLFIDKVNREFNKENENDKLYRVFL